MLFANPDRSVPALRGLLDRGCMVVVGACLGLGTVKEWRLRMPCTRNRRTACPKFEVLALASFSRCPQSKRFGKLRLPTNRQNFGHSLSDLSKKQPDGQTENTTSYYYLALGTPSTNDAIK